MPGHQNITLEEWSLSPSNFFWLANRVPASKHSFFPQYPAYERSWLDVAFVAGWTVIFALLREFMMRGVFAPFMRCWIHREHRARLARNAVRARGKKQEAPPLANGHSTPASGMNGHVANGVGQELRARKGVIDHTSAQELQSKSKGLTKRQKLDEKKVTRFAEQGWSLCYYIVYWSFGMVSLSVLRIFKVALFSTTRAELLFSVRPASPTTGRPSHHVKWIHINSPWYPFKLQNLWIGFPHTPMPGPVKFYYLSQLAFWFHQIIVLNVEERRKDHYQMMTHHIITTTLMIMSYANGFTRVGCLVLVLFDLCDILLPVRDLPRSTC